jgi:hypothetical protein
MESLMRMLRLLSIPALIGLGTLSSSGAILNISAGATYHDSTVNCSNLNGSWPGCGVNSFVSTSIANQNTFFESPGTFGGGTQTIGEENFATAFSVWAATQTTKWTLVTGSDLNLTLTVDPFRTKAYTNVGGLNPNPGITITVSNYTPGVGDPALNQLVWSQGLAINFRPGGGNAAYNTSTVYNTMDDYSFNQFTGGCTAPPANSNGAAGTTYCDPIYPFQDGNVSFSDSPLAPYPNGSFRGVAMLSSVSYGANNTATLTVYDGVSYGFDTFVTPEPGGLTLLIVGLIALLSWRERSRMAAFFSRS